MFPLRLSLFALLLLAVLGMSQEAEADAPTIELLTPQSDSWVPASSSDDYDIYFTWNSTDADGDALIHKVYFGHDKDDLDQIGSTTDEVLKYTTDITYNATYYWKVSADDGGGVVFSDVWNFSFFERKYDVWTDDEEGSHVGITGDGKYKFISEDNEDCNDGQCSRVLNEFNEVILESEDRLTFTAGFDSFAIHDGFTLDYYIDGEKKWSTDHDDYRCMSKDRGAIRYLSISEDSEYIGVATGDIKQSISEGFLCLYHKSGPDIIWKSDNVCSEDIDGCHPNAPSYEGFDVSDEGDYMGVLVEEHILVYDFSSNSSLWGKETEFQYLISFSGDGEKVVFSCNEDGSSGSPNDLCLYDSSSGDELWVDYDVSNFKYSDISYDGNHLIVSDSSGTVYYYDTSNSTYQWSHGTGGNNAYCKIDTYNEYIGVVSWKKFAIFNMTGSEIYTYELSDSIEDTGFSEYLDVMVAVDHYENDNDNLYFIPSQRPVVNINIANVSTEKFQPVDISTEFIYAANNITDFNWKIDGSSVSTSSEFSHEFTTFKEYSIELTATSKWLNGTIFNSKAVTSKHLLIEHPTIEITNNPARYVTEGDQIFNCVADVHGTVQTYEWTSSIDGIISSQKSFVTQLSNGSHNISVRVQDNYGFWSDYDYVDVKVSGLPWISEMKVNPNPVELDQGTSFTASSYIEEGSVVGWTWTSSLDGAFGISENVTDALTLGTHTISLVLESDTGNTSQTFTRTLIVINSPPHIDVDNMSIFPSEGVFNETTFDFVGKATDFHSLTYEWASSIDGVLSTSTEFSTGGLSVGHHDLTFTATDEYGESSSYTYSNGIWVKSRPVVELEGLSSIAEDTQTTFVGTASDIDGTVEHYYWDINNQDYDEDSNYLIVTFTEPGVYNISLMVKDNDGLASNFAYVEITVLDVPDVIVNKETVISRGDGSVDGGDSDSIGFYASQNINQISIYLNITGDSGLPFITSEVTVTIRAPSVTEFTESYSLNNGQTQSIQFSTNEGELVGEWELFLEADDAASDFTYDYKWYNYYPPDIISDQETVIFTAIVTDTDSTSHTFDWTSSLDGNLGDTNPITIPGLSAGQHEITVTATDGDGMVGSYLFDITVGQSPVLTDVVIPDVLIPGEELVLGYYITETSASDHVPTQNTLISCTITDSTSVTVTWELIHPNETVIHNSGSTCSGGFQLLFSGTYYANMTVTNELGFSTVYGKTITVLNRPRASISEDIPVMIESGTLLTLNGTVVDTDGTIISYTWESSIDGVLSLEQSVSVTLSPGIHDISFLGTDNEGLQSQKAWTTINVFSRPVIYVQNDIEVDIGEAVLFSPTVYDFESIAKYEWDFNGDGIFDWASQTTGETTYMYNEKGVYKAKLQVTDNDGITANSTRTIAVATQLPKPESEETTSLLDPDNNLLLAATVIGVAIVGAAVVLSRKKAADPYAQPYPEPVAKPKETKKKKVKSFTPKGELVNIECPGCDAQMKVPKLNELQEVTCKECGLSGEIEI